MLLLEERAPKLMKGILWKKKANMKSSPFIHYFPNKLDINQVFI